MSTTDNAPTPQMLLPGQAAASSGPADMMTMYLMHHAFRRDLARFVAAVAATPVEDRATWRALAARWVRFSEVLHHHHTAEDDLIWPYLLERADAGERETLAAMEEEHGEIDPLLSSVADGFAAFAAFAGEQVPEQAEALHAALSATVVAARAALTRHLDHEETGAIPVLQRHTTAGEWKRIEKQIGRRKSTLSLSFMVGWYAEDVPPAQREEIFAAIGLPFKVLWLLTRGRFRRGERRAFRYAGVR